MNKFLETNRLHHLLGWTLLGLLLILLALEGWRYGIKPSEGNNEQLIERSLDNAANRFLEQQEELLEKSADLAGILRPALLQSRARSYLYETMTEYPQFWSIGLFKERRPIVWNGFALQNNSEEINQEAENSVRLKKFNNVIYWECHIPFSIRDSTRTIPYDLLTSYRIEQSNPLSIGEHSEYNIFDSHEFSTAYPLNFSIFSNMPDKVVQSKQLSNLDGDSVGVVYATADQFQQTKEQWEQNTRFWRSVYALLCFIILVFILFIAADRLSIWPALIIQLLFIGIGWAIFSYTNTASYWVLAFSNESGNEWISLVESLSATATNAIFALLVSVTISRKLNLYRRKIGTDWYLTTISLAGFLGIINALAIPAIFDAIYNALSNRVPILDLRIFPDGRTILVYLIIGISVLAAGIILVALNRLLFRVTREHVKLSTSVIGASFLISLFIVQLFIQEQFIFNWIFYSSILAFAIVLGISLGYVNRVPWVISMSPLRKVFLGSLVIAIAGTPIVQQAALNKIDDELWQKAFQYSQEEDAFAAGLTQKLLTNLEKKFRKISEADLENNRSTLQTRFTETIQSFLSPEWNTYSFDLQLINASGELIADYATDLNSPNWLSFYEISTLRSTTEIEQITKSTIRPITQKPQLVNQEDYSTFYRGWIPVFGTAEKEPIAWILCSIYQERPVFNKPIRAVMASLTYEDWNMTYLMQKFNNQKLVNSVQQGFASYFPKYRTLGENKLETLENDSLLYQTQVNPDHSYRTLLWKKADDDTIRVSTTLPDYRLILFTLFRFSFTLLLVSCIGVLLKYMITQRGNLFMGESKRFQDRILDSFLLATLIFLAFLIATSHYAIKQQNQDIVQQELVDKLDRLSRRIQSRQTLPENINTDTNFSLDSLTTPLDVDAAFYADRTVTETTTPQIYQQNLLPAVLPYEIYHKLYNERMQDAYSTVTLASQTLLIGYRTILNKENQPIATIAIPTFLESPKYNQQLLETTSYLILIYLLVFGLFIVGSTFISRQLTRPLVYIQRGLNKISSGNLNTTIPVTSDDEIGNLARAYNTMVYRLKKLQNELATAEREAAWKEMAQQVAHEIKNPLTPMKLNVQHLERQLKGNDQDPEELKKRVQKITNNLIEQIQSLNHIASDFSKFSQPIEEDFKRVNLNSILSSVAELYEHDEKIEICFKPQNSSIYTRGIADELKRVIINLVKNAYEAMPSEGGKIVLRLYQQQQHAFIEVEDNGYGIPEEDRPNIFVPNFSTKSSGTGLGLAICKKIVEAHRGSISFASVEGEGTTFVIKLPQS